MSIGDASGEYINFKSFGKQNYHQWYHVPWVGTDCTVYLNILNLDIALLTEVYMSIQADGYHLHVTKRDLPAITSSVALHSVREHVRGIPT